MQWAGYLSALVVTNESGSALRRVHPPFICQRPRLVPRFIFGFHFFNVDNNRHIGKPGTDGKFPVLKGRNRPVCPWPSSPAFLPCPQSDCTAVRNRDLSEGF